MNKFRYSCMTVILASALGSSIALSAETKPVESTVQVRDAWVRPVPPSAANTAAYFTLKNPSKNEVRLLKAESAVAKAVELHNHIHQNGMMKMEKVESVAIPPQGEAVLKPMGYHVMLIGLKPEFRNAKSVELRLIFSNGQSVDVKAPIGDSR